MRYFFLIIFLLSGGCGLITVNRAGQECSKVMLMLQKELSHACQNEFAEGAHRIHERIEKTK